MTESIDTTEHYRPPWRFARWIAGAAIVVALLAAACGDDGAPASAGGATPSASASPAATSTAPAAVATPRMLPVTPVAHAYGVVDPAFEPLRGARAIYGEHQGAGYRIEVPDDWNGEVVYYAHGFRGNPPQLTVSMPPLRAYMIERGYAWAASSYSKNGYEPGAGARDTYALRDVFEERVGTPERSYIFGQSMGGHVASLSLELWPEAYDGALTECGVVSGHEILDYFLSWGALSGYFTGVDLYGAANDPNELGSLINGQIVPALGPLSDPTEAGRAFASAIKHLTGGERPFFREGLGANYIFNFVILVNAAAAAGPSNAAAQNLNVEYVLDEGFGITPAELNREIGRVQPNSLYRDRSQYPEFADMTGEVSVPHLALHNTGDLFVPISLQQSYRRIVDEAGNGDLLVQRAIRRPGHCDFSEQERRRAFDDLVAWARDGVKPAGDDLTGSLLDVGREFTDPPAEGDPGGVE